MNKIYLKVLIVLFVVMESSLLAQGSRKLTPQPNAPMAMEELRKWTGNEEGAEPGRDIKILWLCGPEDHGGGEHDYIRIKELFVPMLKTVPRVTVDEAFSFPTQDQFDQADLLIQYLHLPKLTDEQFRMYHDFVHGGGAVVSIHESCIMRPVDRAEKLAECIGCSWKGHSVSKWSKFNHDHPLYLNTRHPVFTGLPASILFNDESYWNLLKRDDVEVVGAVAPATEAGKTFAEILEVPGVRGDAFWTFESGKGKVFGTTTGHYTYTFHDPMYRLLLMRGVAWVLGEEPAPFMPLVFRGLTMEDGRVGTTDSMLDYKNRKR